MGQVISLDAFRAIRTKIENNQFDDQVNDFLKNNQSLVDEIIDDHVDTDWLDLEDLTVEEIINILDDLEAEIYDHNINIW
ncbi:hypothetical protein C8R30_101150 [Nitrosomonas nitrosa]|uniref:hypothetical protein n=1 Tax=Nitrosomonas nitrosa TaxID=52442 RepID=UPI000D302F0E|nr:hypothetical protein [Nitrosomonas nitrosa]PTR04953.1 hypothetical protein C8R30_101150 [Nitrosomonas nitrosa]